MSDETPTSEPEEPAAAAAPDEPAAVATIAEPAALAPVATAAPITFRSKFLMPLIVPIGVAATIIFYVLNVSRIFLAGEDALAVTFASVITVLILGGGTALAASPKLRSSSLTLILGGGFLLLLMGGLISIGAASPTVASGPTQCSPITSKITIQGGVGGALRFGPPNPTVKGGCVQITFQIVSSSHTFQFDDPTAASVFPLLDANTKVWAAKLPPGSYKFHCTIPGHETAGMIGTLTVT